MKSVAFDTKSVAFDTKSIENYRTALSLGYTKSMPEVYAQAGIDFKFSGDHICMLADFVASELEKLDT